MRKLRLTEKLCHLLETSSHHRSKRKASFNVLFGFGFVFGAAVLVLTTIIFMFPSISSSLINPVLQNNYVKVTLPEEEYSSSTTISIGIPTASPELSSSFTLDELSDTNLTETSYGGDKLSETNLTETSYEGTRVAPNNLTTVEEFLGTKDNITTTTSNLSGDDYSSRPNDEKKQSNVDEDEDQSSYSDCDMFEGEWLKVEDRNLYYPPGSCPYLTRQSFSCQDNGRPDDQYLQWQWEWLSKQTNPRCNDIPSILNATDFLERLRGKKLVFVGDSLNSNMFSSLLCILWNVIPDKTKVSSPPGKFKSRGDSSDYNCTVVFVWSSFLVSETNPISRRNNSLLIQEPETLRLDLIDDMSASVYRDADVIVFDSFHWWVDAKTNNGINYFQEGNYLYPKLDINKAYKKGLATWRKWMDRNIDPNKTQVVFRGYSETHYVGGRWNTGGHCNLETEPIMSNETYVPSFPRQVKILENTLRKMKTPVIYLNVSKLTYYRADAHPSAYAKNLTAEERIAAMNFQDCSHWCLPGVPDTWNELLYASLLKAGKGSFGRR
ncbi:hypothetical protein MKW92_015373 [Papaver armeniacum]|nr:hypothetical protein MKW92_015373 [Papaver armeniacum]